MSKSKLEDEALARLCSTNSPLALSIAATTGCFGVGGFGHGKQLTDCFWDHAAKRTSEQRRNRPELDRGRISLGMTHAVGARARDIAIAIGAVDGEPDDETWDLAIDTPQWWAKHGDSFRDRFVEAASAHAMVQIEQYAQHVGRCVEMIRASENEPAQRVPVLVLLSRMGNSYSAYVDDWKKHDAWMKLLRTQSPLQSLAEWYAAQSDGKARRAAFILALTAPFDAPLDAIGSVAGEGEAAPVSTVRDVQRVLKACGAYDDTIDGDFGPASRKALFNWLETQTKSLPAEYLYHHPYVLPWARASMSRVDGLETALAGGSTGAQPSADGDSKPREKPTTPQVMLLKTTRVREAIVYNDEHAKDLLAQIRTYFDLTPKQGAGFGYDERTVQRVAVVQKKHELEVDGKIGVDTREVLEPLLFDDDLGSLWPTPEMVPAARYDHFSAVHDRVGYARRHQRAILLGLRGVEPFATRAHPVRSVREYDDAFVLLQWDDRGKRVRVFPGATHPYQTTSESAPDMDRDGTPDVGMLRPGIYSVKRCESPHHGFHALRVLTPDGRGDLPAFRDLDHDGTFTIGEKSASEHAGTGDQVNADGAYATGILFHPGFTTTYRDRSGKTRPFSSIGCQTAELEDIEVLWEVGTFDYVLVDVRTLSKS